MYLLFAHDFNLKGTRRGFIAVAVPWILHQTVSTFYFWLNLRLSSVCFFPWAIWPLGYRHHRLTSHNYDPSFPLERRDARGTGGLRRASLVRCV